MDQQTAESILDPYEELRDKCYSAARANDGALMGEFAWLRHALDDHDIWNMYANPDGIQCIGMTFTCQTQGNERFDFVIPYDAL